MRHHNVFTGRELILLASVSVWIVMALSACKDSGEEVAAIATTSQSPSEQAPPVETLWATPIDPRTPAQLAYIGTDGALWLVTEDGAQNERLTDRCPGNQIQWSPDGKYIACNYFSIAIFDADGREIWRRDHDFDGPGANFLEWSPDSRQLAFRDEDEAVHVVDVIDGTERAVYPGAFPIGWLAKESLLVGSGPEETQVGGFVDWETYELNLDTGTTTRIPYFDRKRFWLAPTGEYAVITVGTVEDGVGLAIYDLTTGVETPVPPVRPTASHGIPGSRSIVISKDGTRFFVANSWPSTRTTIYSCAMDASGCQSLGTVPGVLLSVSDQGLVGYLALGGIPETLSVADMAAGTTTIIGPAHPNFDWRPSR